MMVTRMEWLRQNWATAKPMPDAPPVMRAWAEGRNTDIFLKGGGGGCGC